MISLRWSSLPLISWVSAPFYGLTFIFVQLLYRRKNMLHKWIIWINSMNNLFNKVEAEANKLKIIHSTIETRNKNQEWKVFTTRVINLLRRSFNNNFTNHRMDSIEASSQREKWLRRNSMTILIWNHTTKSKFWSFFNLIYVYL